MKTTEAILNQVHQERNHSTSTQKSYTRAIKYFEKHTGKTLGDLLTIADHEETDNVHWKNSTLKPLLVSYRKYLFDNYSENTAELYLTAVMTIFRHFEIVIGPLPYYSKNNIMKSPMILPGSLPDRDILKQVLELKNPLLKAITLFMSSSGMSRIDTLNLRVIDYINATKEYHEETNIYSAISKMRDSEVDIIPCFQGLVRQKTKREYFTFCSHEAVAAINNYLMSRTDDFNNYSPLFQIHERYLSKVFKKVNDQLGLGNAGRYSRFAPHMLRRYHATQLSSAGMSSDNINLLEGRKVAGVLFESYIRIKPEDLKKEYIQALPYLVVEDINRVRTELDVANEKNVKLESENKELREQNERIDKLEQLVLGSISDDKLAQLNKLL